MSPRKYRQTKRLAAAEATRQRIIEATVALHSEKGIAATTFNDIAARAGVGVGTVYHHFPTYDDVVKACGAHLRATVPLPAPEIFDGVQPLDARVRRLARELFAYYERYPLFEQARCDRDKLPVLAESVARREQALESFAREALRPVTRSENLVRTVIALTDFSVYRSLTRSGLSTPAAADQVARVLLAWLSTVVDATTV